MKLICSGRAVGTVFDLLGDKENDMTFSLGWVLANSEHLVGALLKDLTGRSWDAVGSSLVKLQTGRVDHGITDVEIELREDIAIVFEAKRGASLPSEIQLGKYAAALTKTSASQRLLVALTNATPAYAASALASFNFRGILLMHRSWREIKAIVESVIPFETNANKLWLRAFVAYLNGVLQMETRFSNWTYVVSLGQGNPEGWSISWIDIVERRNRYFFPVGAGGWPDPPPNYIAFRFAGRLQSIHHVEGYEVFTEPRSLFPEASDETWDPMYCLRLGPPIRPPKEIRNGPRVNQAARTWCMIDTLLTSDTISDALSESERRSG